MRRNHFAVVSIAAASVAATLAACGSSTSGNSGGGPGSTGGQQQDSGAVTTPLGDAAITNTQDSGGNGNDSGPTGPTFDGGQVSTTYPGPHPGWPDVVDQGGPIIETPTLISITFKGDTLATQLDAFGAQATKNAYWDAVRVGYCETGTTTCVGDGTGTSIALTTAAGTSYTDSAQGGPSTLQTYIQGLIAAHTIPTPTANTLPIFYFPATTTITLDGATSCQEFGGYHNSTTTTAGGSTTFAYAIVPECAAQTGQTLSVLQETTLAASHEIIEASTDPIANQNSSGFYLNFADPTFLPWNAVGGGEVGDLCVDALGLGQDQYVEDGFTVQRIWSLAAAQAGGDPCVPAQTKPYFNTAVEQWLVTEAVGATTTFDADAFSNMAVSGGWTVVGIDINGTQTAPNAYLSITVNGGASATTNNGEKVSIGVTLNQDPGALVQQAGGAVGVLVSYTGASLQSATAGTIWPFLVQSPADATDSGLVGVDASEDMPLRRQIKPMHLTPEQMAKLTRIIHGTN